jgi:V/A-type H+/Na+-transporting ATPase subunit I
MNFLLSLPEPMWRMRVLATRDQSDETLVALQLAGVMHPVKGTALDQVAGASLDQARATVTRLLSELDDVLAQAPADAAVRLRGDVDVMLVRPIEDIAEQTQSTCHKLAAIHREATRREEEAGRWEELARIAALLVNRPGLSSEDLNFDGQALCSRVAVFSREEFELVSARLEALCYRLDELESGERITVLAICAARHRDALETLVSNHGRLADFPPVACSIEEFGRAAQAERARLGAARDQARAELVTRLDEELETLVLLREALQAERSRLELLTLARESQYLTLFEGWVPESLREVATNRLREALQAVHIDLSPARPGDDPPSRLRNPRALQPFETVIGLFATPRYGEWDPTPVVGYFFALFFGLMLGDAAYGLMLLLLARFLLPRLVADPESEGAVQFRRLLATCAVAAILFGVAQGSYFGSALQHFFGLPELALSESLRTFYVEPMTFIVASLVIGLVHVNLAHLLMLVRGIRERLAYAVLGRLGLFGLQLAALPWILRLLDAADWLPLGETAYTALLGLMGGSVLLVIVASVMERGPFLGGILWIFDVSGILGDVMSYARLAGVGLATYFLAYSFNVMATLVTEMLPQSLLGLTLAAVLVTLILVLGHLLNFLLSTITCFVHALRLCFVEFLFKFYEGGGRPYAPFRLRRRTLLPARTGRAAGAATG